MKCWKVKKKKRATHLIENEPCRQKSLDTFQLLYFPWSIIRALTKKTSIRIFSFGVCVTTHFPFAQKLQRWRQQSVEWCLATTATLNATKKVQNAPHFVLAVQEKNYHYRKLNVYGLCDTCLKRTYAILFGYAWIDSQAIDKAIAIYLHWI